MSNKYVSSYFTPRFLRMCASCTAIDLFVRNNDAAAHVASAAVVHVGEAARERVTEVVVGCKKSVTIVALQRSDCFAGACVENDLPTLFVKEVVQGVGRKKRLVVDTKCIRHFFIFFYKVTCELFFLWLEFNALGKVVLDVFVVSAPVTRQRGVAAGVNQVSCSSKIGGMSIPVVQRDASAPVHVDDPRAFVVGHLRTTLVKLTHKLVHVGHSLFTGAHVTNRLPKAE